MVSVRPLDLEKDTRSRRRRFRSGNSDLDRFLETRADKNQGLYCSTYVAINGDDGDGEIVGYVSVAATSVRRDAAGSSDGPREWPALLLGRMAVAEGWQGQGVGGKLMEVVFRG